MVKCFVKFTNMSRVGKQILEIPSGVEVTFVDSVVKVKGPKGQLEVNIADGVKVEIKDNQVTVNVADPEDNQLKMSWGTTASLVANMIKGVTEGFSKQLEVNGVGFKIALSGQKLTLNLGFSHPVDFELPEGIEGKVEKNLITISGIDKQQVGQVTAEIRKLRPPEPYKGKGIKYIDEVIRRKSGKTAVGGEV